MKLLRRVCALWPVLAGGWVYGLVMSATAASNNSPLRVYIGTYTGAKSQGIYVAQFDPAAGRLTAPELAAKTVNPSFLAVHPTKRYLYAVGELSGGAGSGRER